MNLGDIVLGSLVYEVVQPVGIKQVGTASPFYHRRLGIVIIRIVVAWNFRIDAGVLVADIFLLQGVPVVFRMTEDENLSVIGGLAHINTRLVRSGYNLQFRNGFDIFLVYGGVSGMWHIKLIVEPTEQHTVLIGQRMLVHTRQLLRQTVLLNSIMVVQAGLCPPADMEGAVNMALAPLHDFTQFIPVFHLFKLQQFHRCTGNDEAIVELVLNLIKGLVEGNHVLF